ncbi:hypothetical protein RF11_09042 [Thelohanellus kitauei]|uniref:Uncharacterized protein n=1 Tax=Thelohanellus kitauei TaxID=669202 RepID=A0A0C2JMW9_THEKT|nr:hypothetical protein RF11_09042 [Thelohanellus kitauei]
MIPKYWFWNSGIFVTMLNIDSFFVMKLGSNSAKSKLICVLFNISLTLHIMSPTREIAGVSRNILSSLANEILCFANLFPKPFCWSKTVKHPSRIRTSSKPLWGS